MEVDPTRMCELLVGLPDVIVLGVEPVVDGPLMAEVEQAGPRPACLGCGTLPVVKDREVVELIDLPCFGRPTRLRWRKVRWLCRDPDCAVVSWTWDDTRIGAARMALTDRAGRWVTVQVGSNGRSVSEVAGELGCSWHTVNDAVVAYGEALVDDDPDRIGTVTALGLDEALFRRTGPFRRQHWSTQIVDVAGGQLLDVVEGRTAAGPCAWLAGQGAAWRARIRWATLDLSGPYRAVFDTMLPDATQIADPFHLIRLANQRLDECPAGCRTRPSATGAARQTRLPGPASAHPGRRTPRGQRPEPPARAARCRRPRRRRPHHLARKGGRAVDLRPHRPGRGVGVRHPPRC